MPSVVGVECRSVLKRSVRKDDEMHSLSFLGLHLHQPLGGMSKTSENKIKKYFFFAKVVSIRISLNCVGHLNGALKVLVKSRTG